jgi:hypothetical protein
VLSLPENREHLQSVEEFQANYNAVMRNPSFGYKLFVTQRDLTATKLAHNHILTEDFKKRYQGKLMVLSM